MLPSCSVYIVTGNIQTVCSLLPHCHPSCVPCHAPDVPPLYYTTVGGIAELRVAQAAGIVVTAGALLGIALGLYEVSSRGQLQVTPASEGSIPESGDEQSAVFATYFVHFFPGRTADGLRPSSNTQLVPTRKFAPGERVGLRVQTAPSVRESFVVEIRFLRRDTHAEFPESIAQRQYFRIRPGLRTYCCLRMPSTFGEYDLGVLVNDQFVTYQSFSIRDRREL